MVTLTRFWFDNRVVDKLDFRCNKTINFTNSVLNYRKLALLGLISHSILMKPKLTFCGSPRTSLVRSLNNGPIHFKLPDLTATLRAGKNALILLKHYM